MRPNSTFRRQDPRRGHLLPARPDWLPPRGRRPTGRSRGDAVPLASPVRGGRDGRPSEISRGGSVHLKHASTALLPLVSTAAFTSGERLSRAARRTLELMFTVTDVKCRPSVIRHSHSSPLWSGTMKGKGPVWIRQFTRGPTAARSSAASSDFLSRSREIAESSSPGTRYGVRPPRPGEVGVPAPTRGAAQLLRSSHRVLGHLVQAETGA
jgi:hypothetical protein